jgi:putative alpha-1,2-mannosidase
LVTEQDGGINRCGESLRARQPKMRIASQALAIERQASAQSALVCLGRRVSKPKTRAILGLMRLNFLSVRYLRIDARWLDGCRTSSGHVNKYVGYYCCCSSKLQYIESYSSCLRGNFESFRDSAARVKRYTKAHIADFYEFGYIPSDKYSYGAASSTIEYARDSACVANILDVKDPNQIKLRKASAAFEKLFDQSKKMIIPKDSKGEFIKDFNPMSGSYFNEGNSIQYTWANPDLIKFMIARYGESYVYARLLSDIDHAAKRDFVKKGGNTAAYYSMRYNHGNQVSQIMPFAFHLIGKHNESSRYVGAILDKFYSLDFKSGIGHGSDDDQGQLSAWYVLASLGVYDFYGGCEQRKGIFLIPPKFKKARIKLRSNYLEIVNLEKVNNKKFSVYVDGEKLLRPVVDFAELVNSRSIEYR